MFDKHVRSAKKESTQSHGKSKGYLSTTLQRHATVHQWHATRTNDGLGAFPIVAIDMVERGGLLQPPLYCLSRMVSAVVTHPIEISRAIRMFVNTGFAVPIIRLPFAELVMGRALNVVVLVIGSLVATSSAMRDLIFLYYLNALC